MRTLLLVSLIALSGCSTTVPVTVKFPEAPKELMSTCSDLKQTETTTKLSDVLQVVTDNYSQYYECRVKLDSWIEWYKTQRTLFEEIK
jgi:uncharacterized protein YceK